MAGMPVTVTTRIGAAPEAVWDLIADVTRMGQWSPETTRCRWLTEPPGPREGARFAGTNAYRGRRWRTECTVVAADRGREFSFDVIGGGFLTVACWAYTFRPVDDGCEVTETYTDRRGLMLKLFGIAALGITDRDAHNRRTMTETLERLRVAAEAQAGAA
ncbi:polyketide cyclase/dehydrase/lipid transport protein [Krasilnikovia cinnamomea]|uniref:Polyketide cyclase/dehydrase/lipid transport protein n=2 Tax=Krasilnikovia cinnamomea TaxID=349313 RepID=A0A4Q7ZL19_9ACTN|nr:polyketide cyclase/dehydrase/lipid transport protein [Krasilnikovia cinnamomea]